MCHIIEKRTLIMIIVVGVVVAVPRATHKGASFKNIPCGST